jgi:hypothetical protein
MTEWSRKAVGDEQLATAVTPAVAAAVSEVRRTFPDQSVHAWPDGQRGAFVVVEGNEIGPTWHETTAESWLGFNISYLHPEADCYPHHVRADLRRADLAVLHSPFNVNQNFAGVPSVMISRSSKRRDPRIDTPALKALKVLEFVRNPS